MDRLGSAELPESRCDFVLQGAGGELVMRKDCPEIGRRKVESRKLKIEIDMNAGEEGKRKGGGDRGGQKAAKTPEIAECR
jgi:hypothetical protein